MVMRETRFCDASGCGHGRGSGPDACAGRPAAGVSACRWKLGHHVISRSRPAAKPRRWLRSRRSRPRAPRTTAISPMIVLQRNGQPNHFALIEHWKDNETREAHVEQPHVKAAREALKAIETAPYDERPSPISRPGRTIPAEPIYAVTHVDFVPTFRQQGEEMLQTLAFEGAPDRWQRPLRCPHPGEPPEPHDHRCGLEQYRSLEAPHRGSADQGVSNGTCCRKAAVFMTSGCIAR